MTAPQAPHPSGSPAEPGPQDTDVTGVEFFPVNFTTYRDPGLPDLDTEAHVTAITGLLAPFGPQVHRWTAAGHERGRDAVEDRLRTWQQPAADRHGNSVLYWAGHGSAGHLAHHHTRAPIDSGIFPEELAHAIGNRLLHPDNADSWTIIVLDACFSHEFALDVDLALQRRHRGAAQRYLLLSTAARGYADLGAFTHVLRRALTVTFRGRTTIGLVELGQALASVLGGYVKAATFDDRDRLVRLHPDIAATVRGPLDQLDEVQAVIDQLPPDERRHFVPKASGAEFGELAWYFHGRTVQRDHILHWLATAPQGALIVTGPAGAGKSALLGHILLYANSDLRRVLTDRGHLSALPAGVPYPEGRFDLTTHLAGLTLHRTIGLVADAAGLPDLAQDAARGQPATALADRLISELRERRSPLTLLFDALDEADQPLHIARTLLRPLAALPGVRLIVGTRRSTREGPDQPAPGDTDLLDALSPQPHGAADPARGPVVVEVGHDQEALAGYLRAKLTTAKHRSVLHAADAEISAAVHRLVTGHPQDSEPQQFLYVRLAAHELLNDPSLVTDPTPLIGRTHRQLFTRALDRLRRTNPLFLPLLQALGLAQGRGLPDQDGIWARIAAALAPGADLIQVRDTIQDLLQAAAPYLALDQEHGQSVYRLAHRTFTEHFTAAPRTAQAHADITTALIHHATSNPQWPGTHDDSSTGAALAVISPYVRQHLAAHARLGHTAGALDTLGDNPQVLDMLDLTSITTAVFGHGLPTHDLPPAIAGTVLLQHHARGDTPDGLVPASTARRRWWRRLGTTYIQGTPPPAEPPYDSPGTRFPDLITGQVHRRRLHLQLTGHTDGVRAVGVFAAADGTARLATTGYDGTVRVWDPATGNQVGEIRTGHTRRVSAVGVFAAADGTARLATTAGHDRTVRVWDPATGAQVGEILTGHTREVSAVVAFVAADGTTRLATTAGYDRTVRVWDPAIGAQVGEIRTGHTGEVSAVGVVGAPDGTPRLATGSDDGTVRVWDPATGAQVGEIRTGHTERVSAVLEFVAADGSTRLITTGFDGTVRVWDPATGTRTGDPLPGRTDGVYAVGVFAAADGPLRLVTTGFDGRVRVWDPATGAQVGEILTGHTRWMGSVLVFVAADGTARLAIAVGYLGRVRVWDPATGAQVGEILTGHTRRVSAVVGFAAADGTARLATGSDDRTVRVWDPATGAQVGEILTGHTRRVSAVVVFAAADGTARLATTAGYDRTVRVWDPATGAQVGEIRTGHTRDVSAVVAFVAADGTARLATGSDDGTVRVWDPDTGTGTVLPLAAGIHSLAAAHGLLIAGTYDGFLCLDISSMYDDPQDTAVTGYSRVVLARSDPRVS
ncbi:AAA family ATPase [Kitasatospora sp. NPDC094019]|uniref:AAA family ATPase n=1 Tax=Kitasatospora sp. NPDC094019 TaxID=3364091 RepID=UPI0037FF95AB